VEVLDSITQIEHLRRCRFGLAGTRDAWHEGPAMKTVTLTWVDAPVEITRIGRVRLA
jgi:hypothetical protein